MIKMQQQVSLVDEDQKLNARLESILRHST